MILLFNITCSVIVFRSELDTMLNPSLFKINAPMLAGINYWA